MPIGNGLNRLLFSALTDSERGVLRRKVNLQSGRTKPRKVTYRAPPISYKRKEVSSWTPSESGAFAKYHHKDSKEDNETTGSPAKKPRWYSPHPTMAPVEGSAPVVRPTPVPVNLDDDDDDSHVEANERTMLTRIKQRWDNNSDKNTDTATSSSVSHVDCRTIKLSLDEFAQIYETVYGQRPPPNADRRFYCRKLTSNAIKDPNPEQRALNRKFMQAIKQHKTSKFIKWVEVFPDPFYKDKDKHQPRSSEEFLDAIKESMLTSPGMQELLNVPPAADLQNMCSDLGALGDKAKLTAYQNFVRNYMTPHWPRSGRGNPLGGLLLWHSVGAGKTCSYVAAASSSFELDGWHIILSTPNALSTEFLKSVFDTVCHASFGEHIAKMSKSQRERFKNMSNAERSIEFSNMYGNHTCKWMSEQPGSERKDRHTAPLQGWTHARVANYLIGSSNSAPDVQKLKSCQRQEGVTNDPLYKTLFIIDEAHNFLNTEFYSQGRFLEEKFQKMISMIQQSRNRSKHNSVRFILATATPQNPHPANLFRMLNMMTTRSPNLLPVTDEAYAHWVDNIPNDFRDWVIAMKAPDDRNLNAMVKPLYNFFLVSRGLISYMDVTGDIAHFPHKTADRRVVVRLTEHQAQAVMGCVKSMGNSVVKRLEEKGKVHQPNPTRKGGWGRRSQETADVRFSECVRQASNFADSNLTRYHFDSTDFDPQALRDEMPLISEKMIMLLNLIDEHDADDRRDAESSGQRARPYKHVIYTRYAKDARMLMSCFLADGDYENVIQVGSGGKLTLANRTGGAFNIALLSSEAEMWGTKQDPKFRRMLMKMFNSPKNAHGALIRFLIIDQSMQEGIDLLNVRHLHIFEPTQTDVMLRELIAQSKPVDAWDDSVAKQIIGRVSRFCGSKFLEWDDRVGNDNKKIGWKLTVDRYYEVFDKLDRNKLNKTRTPMELLVSTGSIDLDYLKRLGNQVKVRNLAIMAAVDRLLWTDRRMIAGYPIEEADPVMQIQDSQSVNVKAEFERNKVAAKTVDAEEDVWSPAEDTTKTTPREEWEEESDESEEEFSEEEAARQEEERERNVYGDD